MKISIRGGLVLAGLGLAGLGAAGWAQTKAPPAATAAVKPPRGATSYAPVAGTEPFNTVMSRMKADKPKIAQRHQALLTERYDLSNRPAKGATMFRGKALQDGVRARLPKGASWASVSAMSPAQIRESGAFPPAFMPLVHPNHPEGGMVFPRFHITEVKKQEQRDLERFDLDFDLPDHFLPEFPPAMFLTMRPDLGDVSQGKLVTVTRRRITPTT